MIKGIILDYGGTLDTGGEHWSHIIKEGWEKAGVVADDALFREAYVYGERELERTLKILPHHNFADLLNIKIQIELEYLSELGRFPGAQIEEKAMEIAKYCYQKARENTTKIQPVLEELMKKYPIVLVSNFYGNLDSVLEDFGLKKYFKGVIESAKKGVRKPDVELLEMGIKSLGISPQETLVVGDSIKNDIEPAKKLGCKTLLLNGRKWGDDTVNNEELESIDSLDQILSFLE